MTTSPDPGCATASGELPAPVENRRLVVVFASAVVRELAHFAMHVGFTVVLLETDPQRERTGRLFAADVSAARLDEHTDVVVTDPDRPELGDVLAAVLGEKPRWIGVMGSPRHVAPHVPALQERGVSE